MGAVELKKLPPVVCGLSLVSGLNDAASEMVYPLLPAFMVGALGAPAAALGALDGAADLTASLVRLVSGRLADKSTKRGPLVLGGYLLAGAIRPLISLAQSAGVVIGLRVADRVGKGLRSPARDAMIAEAVPLEMRGRAFGFHRAFDHGGAVVGGLLGWVLIRQGLSVRDVIAWSVVPGLLVVIVLALTLRNAGRAATSVAARAARHDLDGETDAVTETRAPHAAPLRVRSGGSRFYLRVGALSAILVTRMPETLLILHLLRGGVALAMVPLAWAGLHVVRSASAYPAGKLVDRIGERGVVAISGTLGAIGAWAFSIAASPAALIGVFLALGLVTGIGEPAEKSLVARLAPKGAGRAFGEAQALLGFGALAAGLAFGFLVDARGSAVALLASAVAGVIATAAWLGVSQGEG
ncbi:MAG: MFS transporter [Gemmatimonadota bacterium]